MTPSDSQKSASDQAGSDADRLFVAGNIRAAIDRSVERSHSMGVAAEVRNSGGEAARSGEVRHLERWDSLNAHEFARGARRAADQQDGIDDAEVSVVAPMPSIRQKNGGDGEAGILRQHAN